MTIKFGSFWNKVFGLVESYFTNNSGNRVKACDAVNQINTYYFKVVSFVFTSAIKK